jgi:hypothetical protein
MHFGYMQRVSRQGIGVLPRLQRQRQEGSRRPTFQRLEGMRALQRVGQEEMWRLQWEGNAMSAFSLRTDFKKVQWVRTLWLNLLRAFAAGLVVTIIVLISGGNTGPSGPPLFAMPFLAPLMYLLVLPAYLVAAKIMTNLGGGVGVLIVSVILGLVLAAGDPLVFALHKLQPTLVPTEKFHFMNFTLCLWVLDPQKVARDT